jgi:phosphoribosylanthranilate isomerase
MKSTNPRMMIAKLLSEDTEFNRDIKRPIIKICGLTNINDVEISLQSSANLIGLILAPKSPRMVDRVSAIEITQKVKKYGERVGRIASLETDILRLRQDKLSPKLWFTRCAELLKKVTLRQPLSVGVFQDQPTDEVRRCISDLLPSYISTARFYHPFLLDQSNSGRIRP